MQCQVLYSFMLLTHAPCFLSFQAHMQARYVILRVLLEAGEGLVQLTSVTGSDGNPDVLIKLDREKIESVGRPAIGNFLRKLQVSVNLVNNALQDPKHVSSLEGVLSVDIEKLYMHEMTTARKTRVLLFVSRNQILDG